MRWFIALAVLLILGSTALAQTETPTPTPTPTSTATPAPYVQFTLSPPDGTPPGQLGQFEYSTTAGELHIANLLTALLFSLWGMFLFMVIFTRSRR